MIAKQKDSAGKVIRDIRRANRRQCSAEEKIRFELEGLRGGAEPQHTGRDFCNCVNWLTIAGSRAGVKNNRLALFMAPGGRSTHGLRKRPNGGAVRANPGDPSSGVRFGSCHFPIRSGQPLRESFHQEFELNIAGCRNFVHGLVLRLSAPMYITLHFHGCLHQPR